MTTSEKNAAVTSAHHTVSVTACLRKGNEPGEFSITGEDGRTWGLRSRSLMLAVNVGHRAIVTGFPARELNAEEKRVEKMEKKEKKETGEKEYADLRVTSLKIISEIYSKQSKSYPAMQKVEARGSCDARRSVAHTILITLCIKLAFFKKRIPATVAMPRWGARDDPPIPLMRPAGSRSV